MFVIAMDIFLNFTGTSGRGVDGFVTATADQSTDPPIFPIFEISLPYLAGRMMLLVGIQWR